MSGDDPNFNNISNLKELKYIFSHKNNHKPLKDTKLGRLLNRVGEREKVLKDFQTRNMEKNER